MHVSSLNLRNFRNYAQADIASRTGCVVLVGSNGQGKTNIVEAINYLATLTSHRTSIDSALIKKDEDAAIIRIQLSHEKRNVTLEAQLNRSGANKAQVNGSPAKLKDFPRYISTVIFAPEDLLLIRGEPATRRKFLDEMVVARIPRMAGTISDYERVLKQRNTLLKSAKNTNTDLSTLDIWDERLVHLGSEIAAERARLIDDLREPLNQAYSSIAGSNQQLNLELKSGVCEFESRENYEKIFQRLLTEGRRNEIERGVTLIGPHRDDLELILNNLPAKGYASHGETWSFALAIKLAAARLLRAESVLGDPILILDDVFAELDSARRENLAQAVSDFEQIFITAAVEADVPASLMNHVFYVKHGTIAPAA